MDARNLLNGSTFSNSGNVQHPLTLGKRLHTPQSDIKRAIESQSPAMKVQTSPGEELQEDTIVKKKLRASKLKTAMQQRKRISKAKLLPMAYWTDPMRYVLRYLKFIHSKASFHSFHSFGMVKCLSHSHVDDFGTTHGCGTVSGV